MAHLPGWLHNGSETAVSTTAVEVLAENRERKQLILDNTGAASVRVGVSGLTDTTGFQLASGEREILSGPFCPVSAIYCIADTTTDSTVLAQEVTG